MRRKDHGLRAESGGGGGKYSGENLGQKESEKVARPNRRSSIKLQSLGETTSRHLRRRVSKDYVDIGLTVSQDAVKTVITQCFRSCAFSVDALASLMLIGYDYVRGKEDDKEADWSLSQASLPCIETNGISPLPTVSETNSNRQMLRMLSGSSSDQAFDALLREVEGEEDTDSEEGFQFSGDNGYTHSSEGEDRVFTPPTRKPSFGFGSPLRFYRNTSITNIENLKSSWRKKKIKLVTRGETALAPSSSDNESGLFEDIENFLLDRVDYSFWLTKKTIKDIQNGNLSLYALMRNKDLKAYILQQYAEKGTIGAAYQIQRALAKRVENFITPSPNSNIQLRKFIDFDKVNMLHGVGDIVECQGYNYEQFYVVTADGYHLRLERIPNKKSKRVLFLQHGVMDSSFTWCCNGADNSFAFRAHDAGYDVFLGNFRGAGVSSLPRRHNEDLTDEEFWDFSINEHAFEDIPAMVSKIVNIKKTELRNIVAEDLGIVTVAHSMGGAAVLMYLLRQRELGIPHHLDGLLLATPAGIHVESPLYAKVGGRALDYTLAKLLNSFRFPEDRLTRAATKFMHDVRSNLPAVEGVVSVAIVNFLGGNEAHPRMGMFSTVQQLTQNILTCGTSTKVYTHLRQFIATKKFQAFDYEPSATPSHFSSFKGGNMKMYGTPRPPEFTSLYHLINVPVHLIAGRGDRLIGPSNILRHYELMRRAGVDVQIDSYDGCGHADFTCGMNTQALHGLLNACDGLMERTMAQKKTLKELKRKKLITAHHSRR